MARRGFTLIELLVVISIIALLSSVVLASLNSARDKARFAAGKQFASHVDRVAGELAGLLWDFDECSGTSATDRSGFGSHGTLTGPTWSSTTPFGVGCSLSFDGVDDYVIQASVPNLLKTEGTYSAWIRPATLSGMRMIIAMGHTSGGGGNFTRIYQNNDAVTVDLWVSSSNLTTSQAVLRTNEWTHVAFVNSVSQSKNQLYVNGALVATGTTYQDSSSGHSYIWVGDDPGSGSYPFAGLIDAVHVFAKPLTASEVGKIYASERSRFAASAGEMVE